MTSPIDWKTATAPSLAEMETLATSAWERIAPEFRDVCTDLVIRIEDMAPDDVLDELEVDSPFDLTAYFLGATVEATDAGEAQEPDLITLYRRAIIDYWADSEDTLSDIVVHVIIQELGNHFGFSEAELDELEDAISAKQFATG